LSAFALKLTVSRKSYQKIKNILNKKFL